MPFDAEFLPKLTIYPSANFVRYSYFFLGSFSSSGCMMALIPRTSITRRAIAEMGGLSDQPISAVSGER